MKIQIIGKNISVTDGIREKITKKLSKLDKYFDKPDEIAAQVLVRTYKVGAKIELTIFTPYNFDLRAEVKDDDLYNAIDKVIDKLKGQMRKLKTIQSRKKDKINLGKALVLEQIEEEVIEEEKSQIVRSKSIELEPITLDDAIKCLEGTDHSFYIYLDSDDNVVSVVYKRSEGGYGVIEVENKLLEDK